MAVSNLRKRAEEEANLDLKKDLVHLLTDIHDELLQDRPANENLVHAQKRLASLQVRMARSADRQSRIMCWLTWVLIFLTGVMLFKMFFPTGNVGMG